MQRITPSSFLPFHQLPSHNFPEVITLLLCWFPAVHVYFPCLEESHCDFVVLKSIRANSKWLRGTSWKLKDNTALLCVHLSLSYLYYLLLCNYFIVLMSLISKITQRLNSFCCIRQSVPQLFGCLHRSFFQVPLVNSSFCIQFTTFCFRTSPLS